jgi:hypothetical protein
VQGAKQVKRAKLYAPPWRQIGPYSSEGALAGLDARSREWRYLKQRRAELIAHVGGSPSAIQLQLIERCAILMLRCRMMDRRLMEDGGSRFTGNDSTQFCAWSNALSRTLVLLDLTVTGGKGKRGKPRFLSSRSSIEILRAAVNEGGATVADLIGDSS